MNKEFFEVLEIIEKERNIPKEYMIEKVEAALLSAFKKENGGNTNARIVIDPVKKDIKVLRQRTVVEVVENPQTEISLEDAKSKSKRHNIGSIVEDELKTKAFGRISAQTAKQVIIQGIREAERDMLVKAYEDKKGKLVSAVVEQIDPQSGNVVVNTGTSEEKLYKSEQIPGESFKLGQHIKVYIGEVKNDTRGPIVSLSRTTPDLIRRLFEIEVPEIADGTVTICGVSRDPGSRAKMSVKSNDSSVDPVGSCIGSRGARINNVINELCGERIDIIKYSDVPEEYIKAALAPATVKKVILETERTCRVIVAPDQLSLAIGKSGQNVSLAARLTGIKLAIKTEQIHQR